ncbi:hypothetical protein [Chitinophaga barathri]|uniref:hypothetical protein n=1 Tax=Chitinophaga barathri TaxID=1647451 RepID=UPI000F4F0226|nr:hypothetical protein [Chitinophaga barathri]
MQHKIITDRIFFIRATCLFNCRIEPRGLSPCALKFITLGFIGIFFIGLDNTGKKRPSFFPMPKDAHEVARQANFERIQKGNSVNSCVNKAATA